MVDENSTLKIDEKKEERKRTIEDLAVITIVIGSEKVVVANSRRTVQNIRFQGVFVIE